MHFLYSFLALDLAAERASAARDEQLVMLARAGHTRRPSAVRRGLAHTLAGLSRASASATRRLDTRVADDLGRALTAGK
ncbi:MAG TPA: hypothetical protein VFI69_12270 [Candidatus Limnocylindrales bacterium]|jgi:hypothetical protein|nr:hypothetical protein [Candidatus Limnocylindrales bacterium]